MREQGTSSKAEKRSQRSAKAHAVDQGVTVLSYLIGGVLVYGGLGWLGDRFFHTGFLLPLGIVLGAALAVYTIIKRFGTVVGSLPPGSPRPSDRSGADRASAERAGADRAEIDQSAADDDH
jgi:F0F1-type ATP synthase assembly protein I